MSSDSPAFGQADLTNCERELIHLAGSIQPHGVLLVVREADGVVSGHSENIASLAPAAAIAGRPLAAVSPALAQALDTARLQMVGDEPVPLVVTGDAALAHPVWEGAAHRLADGHLVVELEPVCEDGGPAPHGLRPVPTVGHAPEVLMRLVGQAVEQFGRASSLGVLCDAAARTVHDIIGYDRVMIYKFDADGHGEIVAEARDPRLESLLGHHYPATDIPQRARELYMRNRVRVLADVNYTASPLRHADGRPIGDELDMSMCLLRSMSPLHLQYLKNMGVTATVVVSLVHEGQLWGLIAAHHYSPRNVRYALRAVCDLLAEVISTRIAAIENYAHAQVAVLVRRLEQRLVEATSTEGDWRLALFRNPRTLLQPLDATGAALFAEDEVLTAGEVPSTPELRQLQSWLTLQAGDLLFSTSSVGRADPALAPLTPTASGVLAVRLSHARPDMIVWFRKEQLRTVTWAGDPNKAMLGDDPLTLSPRRSFAAWSELVRGTALPWTHADLALARAFGAALVDMMVQVHAVRLLVAENQLAAIRATVRQAAEPVLIAGAAGEVLFCNEACRQLIGCASDGLRSLSDLVGRAVDPQLLDDAIRALARGQGHWRGELVLRGAHDDVVPVAMRAEAVPGRDGRPLGTVLTLFDLRHNKRAARARRHLEASLEKAMQHAMQRRGLAAPGEESERAADPLLGAILTNASLAAMDITDGADAAPVAPLLEELENSTRRATLLYERIRLLAGPPDTAGAAS